MTVSLLFGGVILFLIYMIGNFIKQFWSMNFPWGQNKIEDVTALNIPLFSDSDEIIRRLEHLGFEPFSISKVWFFWTPNKPAFVWHFVDRSKTTYVEIFEYKSKNHNAMIGFFSWYPDHALVETFFPIGENIDEPHYSAHFVKEDLEGGYVHHQQAMQRFSTTHGAPIVFQNYDQLPEYDVIDQQRYRRRRYRRLTIHVLSFIAVSLVSIGVMISAIIADTTTAGANVNETIAGLFIHATLLLLCFAVMGILFYFLSNPPGALDAGNKRKNH
jgi:hypothetical protein